MKPCIILLVESLSASLIVMICKRAIEKEKFPLGVFYINEGRKAFEDNLSAYKNNKEPVFLKNPDYNKLHSLIEKLK